MEARDQHAVADRGDELLASGATAGHREVAGVSAGRVAGGVGGMAGRTRAHRLRRGPVVDRSARDALLDEQHLLLRRALHVEGNSERPRVERVVRESEGFARHALADPTGHE